MRYENSITSLSWIPSEAIQGTTRLPFEVGMAHYDPPPPETVKDLEALRDADRFRFANVLDAWVEADQLERGALDELSKGHRREGRRRTKSARD